MNSSQFKKSELKRLSAEIGFKTDFIESIVNNLDNYYNEWAEEKIDKKTGEVKRYKDGMIKKRVFKAPKRDLKIIQTRIKNRILSKIELPDNVHGGVKKRSNITNAKQHQGNKYQLTTDLQDFYPSISSKQVYTTFLALGYSNYFSSLITKLTTWKNELPQGTPTSPHLANLVFLKTDAVLIEFCNNEGVTYTRYVDDLTFSSQQDFRPHLNTILEIIKVGGFNINYRKTKYEGNQNITGIDVFLHKIDAPQAIIERAEQEKISDSGIKPLTNYVNNIRKTNIRKNKRKLII